MRKLLVMCAFCGVCLAPAAAQDVLVFDYNTYNQIGVQAALSVYPSATITYDEGSFVSQMAAQDWDIVLVDNPSNYFSAGGDTAVINYIRDGGAAIMAYWALDTFPAIATAFEASVAADYFDPIPVYDWDHAIWDGVTSPMEPGGTFYWNDDGDRLNPTGSAVAAGGFTSGPASGQAGIVVGNGGRTIINGWMFDNFAHDGDALRLVQNELRYVPEPGSLLLLGLGGLALLRRR